MFQLRRTHSNLFGDEHICNRLVFYERFPTAGRAIRRKREIDGWSRSKKEALIAGSNPSWTDLYGEWGRVARQMPRRLQGGRWSPLLRRLAETAVRVIAAI